MSEYVKIIVHYRPQSDQQIANTVCAKGMEVTIDQLITMANDDVTVFFEGRWLPIKEYLRRRSLDAKVEDPFA